MGAVGATGPGPVVVGIDGVEECRAALVWAAAEAARRGTTVQIVHAAPYPVTGDAWTGGYAAVVLDELDAAARQTLAAASELVRETAPVAVETRLSHESARRALLESADGADLVVTGARRRRRPHSVVVEALLLGSTSLFVASHAPCPAVVVREEPPPGARGIVVGHDGSAQAEAAVRWAADRAVTTSSALSVLTAWRAVGHRTSGARGEASHRADEAAGAAVRQRLDDVVSRLRREHPGLRVEGRVVEADRPRDALLSAAEHAALLVVGARGHGAFASALLGSTSHAVLHRASCPVVVVPDVERARERGPAPGGVAAPPRDRAVG